MNRDGERRIKLLSVINFLLFTIVIGVNYLGAKGFFNGMSQKLVSKKYSTLITPTGFTFSI